MAHLGKEMTEAEIDAHVAVVIPCFRAARSIGDVVASVPTYVKTIVCVNDCSDDNMQEVLDEIAGFDARVKVVSHVKNKGVGGATVTGYLRALNEGAEILVKIDADGQMDPDFIAPLIAPILEGDADYTKGNRFFDLEELRCMPTVRLVGNAGLSLMTKMTTGYWDLFDPTNGFTALHANVARVLPLKKLHQRYFFESDLLFRLSTVRARIVDVPMAPIYGDEVSNMSAVKTLLSFPFLHGRNLFKRIVYNYILRGFSAASLSLIVGLPMILFGLIFGIDAWVEGARTDTPATAGTVMLSAVPLLVGFQLVLNFLQHDVASVPGRAIHKRVARLSALKSARAPEAEITDLAASRSAASEKKRA
ncbi:glycosyltransferase family 2 protein [uncultured Litoreibacter sp.]|uniref:glycosyltransferase family 2 protein n=1 Tax=uncultured Litoreibacter sp. TaxID=1392394 RepID=UPI00262EC55D|nr:glycosyltransferase family 2 protein [uncultured Litoreibacter sp.]